MANWLSNLIATVTGSNKKTPTSSSSSRSSSSSSRSWGWPSPPSERSSGRSSSTPARSSGSSTSSNKPFQQVQSQGPSSSRYSANPKFPVINFGYVSKGRGSEGGASTPRTFVPNSQYNQEISPREINEFLKVESPSSKSETKPAKPETKPSKATGHVSMFDDKFIDNRTKPVEDAGEIQLTDEQFNALSPQAQQAVLLQTEIYNAAKKDLADKSGKTNVRTTLKNLGIDAGMTDSYSEFQGFLGLQELEDLANFDEKLSSELMPKKSDFFEPGYGAMHAATRRATDIEEGKASEPNKQPKALHGFGQGINLSAARDVSNPTITERIKAKQKKDDPKGYEEAMNNLPDEIQGLDLNRLLTRDARIHLSRRAMTKVEEENKRPFEERFPNLAKLEAAAPENTEMFKNMISALGQGDWDEMENGVLTQEAFEKTAEMMQVSPVELSRAIGEYSSSLKSGSGVEVLDGFDLDSLVKLEPYIDLEF